MTEPVIDLSEILDMYKEDARRSVSQMRAAMENWSEVLNDGPARQEIRKLSHQLRGSGRTYGFRNVSRVAKAMEHAVILLQSGRIPADERLKKCLSTWIERLAEAFK
jgi:chemotaxis protein histidine kinase CheA